MVSFQSMFLYQIFPSLSNQKIFIGPAALSMTKSVVWDLVLTMWLSIHEQTPLYLTEKRTVE